jgi:hypothetical protein
MISLKSDTLKNVLIIIILMCFSCAKENNTEQVEIKVGSKVYVKGWIKNNFNDGTWRYYDYQGNLIKEEYYNNNKLKLIKYYSNNELIYIEKYEDGKIYDRIAFGNLNMCASGEYLLRKKCSGCHDIYNNGVASNFISVFEKYKIKEVNDFEKMYNAQKKGLDSIHSKIELSEFEITEVIKFMNSTCIGSAQKIK